MSFFLNSVALGIGLAMDAFSLSLVNGMNDPKMKVERMLKIALVFGFFQWMMPMIGYLAVHTVVQIFSQLLVFVPWIGFGLLVWIGGKLIYDGMKHDDSEVETEAKKDSLLLQAVATSIDALSVGFTVAELTLPMVLIRTLIIGIVTFIICFAGIILGKKFGTLLSSWAGIIGGVILIIIGIETLVTGVFL